MGINYQKYNDELLFLPLGGSNEIGMNFNLYRYKGKWLIIDCGIGFADDYLPGVDIVVPNIDALTPYKKDIVGLVLTHAHEDHVGAVAYLWPDLGCPLYATPFTAAILKNKLAEEGIAGQAKITEVKAGEQYELGPFKFEMVPITHSIPEMHAVAIRIDKGVVMHTGDWKLDANPQVGVTTDEKTLAKYGDEGVLAMVCDSTNVFVEGESGSEGDVRTSLTKIIGECPQRVVVTTFSSNVARLETVIRASLAANRKVALVGKSIWRMVAAAQEVGYLQDVEEFLTDEQGMQLARDKVAFIATGCQGESRAALSKIARGEHPVIRLSPKDTVIFSSRTIPGNERNVGYIHNRLVDQGLEVLNHHHGLVHVSGHPGRGELERMYKLVRPQIAIPTHGEKRHIHEHAKFAKALNVPKCIEMENGMVALLTGDNPGTIGKEHSGYLALDGNSFISSDSQVIRTRRKIRDDGFMAVSVVLRKTMELAGRPKISAPGCLDPQSDRELLNVIADDIAAVVERGKWQGRLHQLEEAIRQAMRKVTRDELGKKPVLDVHIHQI